MSCRNYVFSLFIFLCSSLFARNLGVLSEVVKPGSLQVANGTIYITQGAQVLLYRVHDLQLLKTFGKEGDGPGEVQNLPQYLNKLHILPDRLVQESQTKMVSYSLDGQYLNQETRKPSPFILQAIPAGEGYILSTINVSDSQNNVQHVISIGDKEMKTQKELCRMPFMQQGQPPKASMDMMFDYPGVSVYEDRIYVEKSHEGFVIDVFDLDGNLIRTISRPYQREVVQDDYKKKLLESLKEDTLVKLLGGWDQFKQMYTLTFPTHFPPFRSMNINQGRIYCETYKPSLKGTEIIVLDLEGKAQNSCFIDMDRKESIIESLLGAQHYAIDKQIIYSLREDIENEEWQIHAQALAK